MTLAIERSPGSARSRRRVSAVQRWRAADQLHKTGWCPVLSLILVVATAPRASRNTYRTDLHHAVEQERLDRLAQRSLKGHESCASTESQFVSRRWPFWRRRLNKSRRWTHSRESHSTNAPRRRHRCAI